MTLKRKISIFIVLIFLAMLSTIIYFWISLNSIVADSIEKHGTQIMQTSVTVGKVNIKPFSGTGSIQNIQIANPKDFSQPNAFTLNNITLTLEPTTLLSHVIVIDQLTIAAPRVFYEKNASGISNIQIFKNNLEQYLENHKTHNTPSNKSEQHDKKNHKQKVFIIKQLTIQNTQMYITLNDHTVQVNLPAFKVNNIGSNTHGATPAQISKILLTAFLKNIMLAIASSETKKYLPKLKATEKNITHRLKNLLI